MRYSAGDDCRWIAVAPAGYVLELNCGPFRIPSSSNCVNDRLEISLSGRSDLADAQLICGTGTFTKNSQSNRLVVALRVAARTNGGIFACTIKTAQECKCGRRKTSRIVGGMETEVNEFTMMAGLVDIKARLIKCGATISTFYCS